jgi:hypothetical protein
MSGRFSFFLLRKRFMIENFHKKFTELKKGKHHFRCKIFYIRNIYIFKEVIRPPLAHPSPTPLPIPRPSLAYPFTPFAHLTRRYQKPMVKSLIQKIYTNMNSTFFSFTVFCYYIYILFLHQDNHEIILEITRCYHDK